MNRQSSQIRNEEILLRVRQHLQRLDARERIRQYAQKIRSKATVTTSRAADLLDLGQQQLRDWDKRGLIKTTRPALSSPHEGKTSTGLGHRQFTFDELDKLAVIKELIDQGDMSPSDLLPYIEDIWREGFFAEQQTQVESQEQKELPFANTTINQRIRNGQEKLFWRFFASHALRFSLFLIREDKPTGIIGLILPLHKGGGQVSINHIDDLSKLGETLVGWLLRPRFSHVMLASSPSFDVPTDYRIHPLTIMRENEPQEVQQDNTHLLVRRDAASLTLSPEVVETVRGLLQPLYENVEKIESCFGLDMYDMIDLAPSRDDTAIYPSLILNGLANMVIQLGGKVNNPDYWRFCCILLPLDSRVPVQERTLVVRAQSNYSPHKIGVSSVPPDLDALSLHAFQSGLVCYRNKLTPTETVIAYRSLEHPINSAIAVPIGGEDGEPIGVIYVASEYEGAFSNVQDRRILRILSRMVGELVRTYQLQWQGIDRVEAILRQPDIIDEFLGIFPSENDFIRDLEGFLRDLKAGYTQQIQQQAAQREMPPFEEARRDEKEVQSEVHVISLLGIDIDHVTLHALKYGDRAVRNLYREISLRIAGELDSTFKKYPGCQFYHIVADRFYVLLKYVPYDQVLKKAWVLKKSLADPYQISIVQPMGKQPPASGTLVELTITVRLAVSSYNDNTLDDLFERYPGESGIFNLREMIERSIATELKKGMASGGNIIRAFNPKARIYEQLVEEE